jgi:hypothetical protein
MRTRSVDKDYAREIEEVVLPMVGGYEIISNTSERPENKAMKVFVLCVKL